MDGNRYEIKITVAQDGANTIERIGRKLDASELTVFNSALALLDIATDAWQQGKHLCVTDTVAGTEIVPHAN